MPRRRTFQYVYTMSINRDLFLEVVVRNENLSKKDLRVVMHLMAVLDNVEYKDVSLKQIARDLNLSKKDVDKSLTHLIEEGIISEGYNSHSENGLKLLF